MGKLPKSARGNIPMLMQLDGLEKKLLDLKAGVCDECRKRFFGEDTESKPKEGTADLNIVQCEVEGCDYGAKGRTEAIAQNNLRLHNRTHEVKKEEETKE